MFAALASAAQTAELAAIFAGWLEGGQTLEGVHGFALGLRFGAGGLTLIGLVEEQLGFRCWASDLAELEDLHGVQARIRGDLQVISWLTVPFDPAEVARLDGNRARFEETRSPQPFVDTDACHASLFPFLTCPGYQMLLDEPKRLLLDSRFVAECLEPMDTLVAAEPGELPLGVVAMPPLGLGNGLG